MLNYLYYILKGAHQGQNQPAPVGASRLFVMGCPICAPTFERGKNTTSAMARWHWLEGCPCIFWMLKLHKKLQHTYYYIDLTLLSQCSHCIGLSVVNDDRSPLRTCILLGSKYITILGIVYFGMYRVGCHTKIFMKTHTNKWMLEHFCVITFTLLHVTCTKFTISYLWGIEKKSFDREGTLKFHYKFFFVVCM